MLRANRALVLKVSVFLVVSMSALLAALSIFANPGVTWFGAGLLVASLYWMVTEVVPGAEYRRLRDAADAEAFTSGELKRLRSAGWTFVDCVEFHGFDVDHVAVGPGGVIAVETKWTNVSWALRNGTLDHYRARQAKEQALINAGKIRLLLAGNARIQVEVSPVLMIWGEGRPTLDGALRDDSGVVIVTKDELGTYIRSLPPLLDADKIRDIALALETFIARRNQYERRRQRDIRVAHTSA